MSSRTSSRSTLTTVPSTMSPSLKYLMVSSIAARKASSEPMSLTATLGIEVASVLLVVMCRWAPDTDRKRADERHAQFNPPWAARSDWTCLASLKAAATCLVTARGLPDHGGLQETQRSDQDMRARATGQSGSPIQPLRQSKLPAGQWAA